VSSKMCIDNALHNAKSIPRCTDYWR